MGSGHLAGYLHRLVALPWVYDLVQVLAGARRSERILATHVARLGEVSTVLDVGGGTGRYRKLWPERCEYLCIDPDPLKLRGYRQKHAAGSAVLGDGALLPVQSGSVDVAVAIAIFHHLPEAVAPRVVRELQRVLRPSGHLIFLDPVWAPRRLAGRLLWRYDRGAFPRTADALKALLVPGFDPVREQRYAYLHEYLLWVGTPRRARSDAANVASEQQTVRERRRA